MKINLAPIYDALNSKIAHDICVALGGLVVFALLILAASQP